MTSQVYIFIGHSGSGKGTQAKLLADKLRSVDTHEVFYLETGRRFRELIETDGYTAKRTKEMIEQGKLPQAFLGIHAWSHMLINEYSGTSHVVIDGTPRVPSEVPILLSAAEFYGWHPHVVFLKVSDEWASEKMKNRGRPDDRNEQEVWGRIQWYHETVLPTVELLEQSSVVTFHTIEGEQTIEAVHADICRELGL
jgi:adenylate kinase family enzyme